MITTVQQAKIIQDRINAIAEELALPFALHVTPNAGEFVRSTASPIINAIFIALPSTIVPLKGLNSYYATNTMRIACPLKYKDELDQLLQTAIGGLNGLEGIRGTISTETDTEGTVYSCVTNCGMHSVSEVSIQPIVGECVIFEMTIFFQLVEGGIISNSAYFGLETADSEEIAWFVDLDSSVTRARIAQTDNIQNEQEMQSAIGQQGLTFSLNVPYLTGEPYKTLMQDLYEGGLHKVYRLSKVDANLGYTAAAPKQWFVVLTEATESRQAGKIMVLSCKFLIANAEAYAEEIAAFDEV